MIKKVEGEGTRMGKIGNEWWLLRSNKPVSSAQMYLFRNLTEVFGLLGDWYL